VGTDRVAGATVVPMSGKGSTPSPRSRSSNERSAVNAWQVLADNRPEPTTGVLSLSELEAARKALKHRRRGRTSGPSTGKSRISASFLLAPASPSVSKRVTGR
jgi:hypothetical protein